MKLSFSPTPRRFFMVLLGVLVALVVVGGVAYNWGIRQMQQRTTTWRTTLAQSVVADDRLDQLTALSKQFKQYSDLAGQLDNVLPHQKDESVFSLQLQNLAQASGLNLTSVNFPSAKSNPSATSQTSPVGSVLALPVTVQGLGSFAALESFLQRIEQLGRFTNVSTLTINHASDGHNLSCSITITTYVKP